MLGVTRFIQTRDGIRSSELRRQSKIRGAVAWGKLSKIRPDTEMESGRSAGRRLHGLSVLLSQFGLPALISSMCYWLISPNRSWMMIAMVLGLIFAWMPLNAINLYRNWGSFANRSWFSTQLSLFKVSALCHVSAMTSAALNPVIYSWFTPQLRGAI
ncbi:unnamed protein product [Nippostrongylus brasiliensis]|uniref:Permease n=1 Tax=Nippostrongylus brasiliensis TaxID=27835 RepID=A0A158R2D2_NIPBR|nr:unnamed protein product [Nippostrongylus brasiliensis]